MPGHVVPLAPDAAVGRSAAAVYAAVAVAADTDTAEDLAAPVEYTAAAALVLGQGVSESVVTINVSCSKISATVGVTFPEHIKDAHTCTVSMP